MAPPGSRWWQASDEGDLDYGFDSDDLDARFNQPERNPHRALTREIPDQEGTERNTLEQEDKGVFGNMSSWLQRQAGSSNNQLATTAVLSGAAVAGAIFGYQAYRRKEAVHDLKASIPIIDDDHPAGKVKYLDPIFFLPLDEIRGQNTGQKADHDPSSQNLVPPIMDFR